jgi:lipoate-protein ligase A
MSGGGAVFHDLGGLNYTLITDDAESPVPTDGSADADAVWQACMAPLLAVLRGYGLEAQFSGRNDIEIGGRKIAGCAQYARGGRTLHHGCILFDTDLSKVAAALDPGEAKFLSKSDKSVRTRVTTVRTCRADLSIERFRQDLRAAYGQMAAAGGLTPYALSEADNAAIWRLREGKYRTWEWNYGYRADYQVRRQKKFPAGLVTADMDVKGGVIERIHLSGDFFLAQAGSTVEKIEQALCGLPLNDELAERIRAALDADTVLHGISAAGLAALLLS